jgi:ABC-type dipeptide/oligopeptide/nickel transport system permease component
MQRYVLSRLSQLVITIFVVSLLVFFLVRLKGDPVSVMAPPTFNVEQIERLRRAWGFDKPLWQQYLIFLRKAITGDFGTSIQHRIPAMYLVMQRLKWTYLLAGASALIALVIAIPLGVVSAVKRNSVVDLLATILATVGTAMPGFWFGIMLMLIFSVNLRLLPAYGAEEPASLIMPALALGTGMAARISRLTRSSMLETLGQDYIRTAYSKGLRNRVVIWRHALRNGLIPVVTAFGLQLGWVLGGSVVIESVFSWPGLGRLMIESIHIRDITIVQAGLLFFATSFVLINLAVDILYTFLDPRVRYD